VDPVLATHSYSWICSGITDDGSCENNINKIKLSGVAAWRVGWYCNADLKCEYHRWPVEYCLSEEAEPHCKLHFELTIAVMITVLNLCKLGSTFTVLSPTQQRSTAIISKLGSSLFY
jgi:hypothetical protein